MRKLGLISLSILLGFLFSGCQPSENAYLDEGKRYLSQGKFTHAISSLSKAKRKTPVEKDEICPLLAQAHLGRSKELNREGRYQKAMEEYQGALRENRKVANLEYRIELLYGLAEDEFTSSPMDSEILRLQKMVFFNPQAIEYRKKLRKVAFVGDRIIVFGLGLKPEGSVSETQAKLLALRAARVDAQRWLAYHISWQKYGFDKPLARVSAKVPGGSILKEVNLGFGAYLVKMELSRKLLAEYV